ncbi:MAG: tRNA 2-thiouridine(34) synthase MnmA [Thermoanaerobaculia bacterium]|nr:tRNA 2-thiouridine(34) synthase MnmA [Thermoanaerobaculia bacterium]
MRVALLLSGGVDSSVALHLLKRERGLELHAFYLKIWLEDELAFLGECPWEDDLHYARAVCANAGVPLEVVPMQQTYHRRVVADAIAELEAGHTPSPDVWCNERIKFGAFLDHLDEHFQARFDRIASGHYARRVEVEHGFELHKGRDPVKDQTYFLYRLDQRQLGRCWFPLGDLTKPEVRALAHELELPNRDRRDSQGICFLGRIRYADFVRGYLGERPGEVRETGTGRKLGEHRGHWFYTIGQRQGLGLGGGPWFVVAKEPQANRVWVAHRETEIGGRDRFWVPAPCWIGPPPANDRLEVKLRHSPTTLPCRLVELADGGLEVTLASEDPGIAPGQSAVFYDGSRCLGGGLLARPLDNPNPPGDFLPVGREK